jgi:hypothetical protein
MHCYSRRLLRECFQQKKTFRLNPQALAWEDARSLHQWKR